MSFQLTPDLRLSRTQEEVGYMDMALSTGHKTVEFFYFAVQLAGDMYVRINGRKEKTKFQLKDCAVCVNFAGRYTVRLLVFA